jgi:hypothetical protein
MGVIIANGPIYVDNIEINVIQQATRHLDFP